MSVPDSEERVFTGWSIRLAGGRHRFFTSENGEPVHMGDFDEFYKGMSKLTEKALARIAKAERARRSRRKLVKTSGIKAPAVRKRERPSPSGVKETTE